MTYDIFANRQDRPKFEAFCRTQQSSHWDPRQSNKDLQRMISSPQPQKIPLYQFPASGEDQGQWKKFSNFENKKPHATFKNLQQKALKDEINEINQYLVEDRIAKKKARTNSNWNPPNIEVMERSFNEGKRYFQTPKQTRQHGLGYYPEPGDHTSGKLNAEVKKELNWIQQKQKDNSIKRLQEQGFTRKRQSSQMAPGKFLTLQNDDIDIRSLISEATYQAKKDEDINKLFYEKNTIGERGIHRFQESDSQALMYGHSQTYHGRILKLAGTTQASGFTGSNPNGFPRRQRFNQDLGTSIQDIKTQGTQAKKKLRLNSGIANNPSVNSQATGYSNLTKAQLQGYFKEKKKQIEEDQQTRISSIGVVQRFGSKKERLQSAIKNSHTIDQMSPVRSPKQRSPQRRSPKAVEEDSDGEHKFDINEKLSDDGKQEVTRDDSNEEENSYADGPETEEEKQAVEKLIVQLDNEKSERERLLRQIDNMTLSNTSKLNNLKSKQTEGSKLLFQEQRNLMLSGTNFTSHPDAAFQRNMYNGV